MCGRFALGRDRDAILEEAINVFQRGMNMNFNPNPHPEPNADADEEAEDAPQDEDVGEAENQEGMEWIDRDAFYPRYNIAPRSRAPVVRFATGPTTTSSTGKTMPTIAKNQDTPHVVLQTMVRLFLLL